MSGYGISVSLDRPVSEVVPEVRQALADQGFGVLTEIDVRATMKAKLDVDVPEHLILGACNPPLAHRAITAEPSIGLLLPCNVVVRDANGTTVVEAIDPTMMVEVTSNPELEAVADDAAKRLSAALDSLKG